MTKPEQISVLIMEDNELTRVAIRAALEKIDGIMVTSEASDGESAVDMVVRLRPDIVLADIGLPGISGIEATIQMKELCPRTQVVMLTSSDNNRDILNSFDAGADGYLMKEGFSDRLELAIRNVHEGTTWMDPRIARCVLDVATANMALAGAHENNLPEPLSAQEASVLTQLAGDGPVCKDGVCSIDPDFVKKLHRFARSPHLDQ